MELEEGDVSGLAAVDPWPHQRNGVDAVVTAIVEGVKRILVTSPTGGGKTWMMLKTAAAALAEGWGVTLFANRKMLIEQMTRSLGEYGIRHGVRAAGHGRTDARLISV